MASFQHLKRRSIVPLAGLAVAAYYVFVLVPLSRRAEGLNVPLQSAWQRLSASLDQTNVTAIDFPHLTNQLAETRQALSLLENARQKAAARLELSPDVRAKMSRTFVLAIYQDERRKQLEDLGKLAAQCQVVVEPPVLLGFPQHTADMKQPELLWVALSFVDGLLTTAIQCKVSIIHSLEVNLTLPNESPANMPGAVIEIPLQVELTGSTASLLKLLQNLPLRPDEMRTAGLPEARVDKIPLFVERLILKKQSPEKPDEVRLSLRAVGFILRE